MTHTKSVHADWCLLGMANRLHYYMKGQDMLCRYDAWASGLLSFWVHLYYT